MALKEDQERDVKSNVLQIMGVSSLLSVWHHLTQFCTTFWHQLHNHGHRWYSLNMETVAGCLEICARIHQIVFLAKCNETRTIFGSTHLSKGRRIPPILLKAWH